MKAGFTLIELMTAAVVLTIALVGLLTVFAGTFTLDETTSNLTLAINGARAQLERICNLSFSELGAEDGRSFEIAGMDDADSEGNIDVDTSDPDLLVITITVCWQQDNGRIIGEDVNLNGTLEAEEDINNNDRIDSPAQLITLRAENEI